MVGYHAHLLIEIIASKLHCGIGHNSDAISAIASHEPSPSLVLPHLRQALSHGELVFFPTNALYLEENL